MRKLLLFSVEHTCVYRYINIFCYFGTQKILNSFYMSRNLKISYSVKNDVDLWLDFKGGDKNALDQIYNDHVPYLISYGNKFTSNNSLVDDCIQDLFVDLWVKRARLSSTDHIRYYLLKGLKRRIIRNLGKPDRDKCFSDFSEMFLESNSFVEDSEPAEESPKVSVLQNALNKLSMAQREIIYLKYYAGLKIVDISELMNLNKKQVYNALSKAMITLKKHLNN